MVQTSCLPAEVDPRDGDGISDATLARLSKFLLEQCEPPRSHIPVEQRLEAGIGGRAQWTQEVDCMKLLVACPDVGNRLYNATLDILTMLKTQSAALCVIAKKPIRADEISIRLTHVPTLTHALPSLPHRKGELVQVCGSIVRMGMRRVVPYAYRLMCPRCHTTAEAFSHPYDRAAPPHVHCERAECKKEELQIVGQEWMDYCECRLQQRSNQSGKLPKSILVLLDEELSVKCAVGQFVEVVGMLHTRWSHTHPFTRPTIEPAIWTINVLPMEAYRDAARISGGGVPIPRRKLSRQGERPKFSPEMFFSSFCKDKRRRGVALANSVCPQLSGLFAPRMSILLSAVNGASTAGKTSVHVRSTIHCLFVGDPSTGKSQLLHFAASVAPRSTSTTGMGSTSAGLTVAATKEMGEFVLEPGALVLSDGGVCAIDELRTVSPSDRASLHEAMEQQTISVAKGGMVTRLRTACSVLSACNPPAQRSARGTTIGIGGPLLSRFDFIFLLWDTPQRENDERIAEHVLSCSVAYQHPDPPLATDELADYLRWVRTQYAYVDGPLLSDSAADLLARYYDIQGQRGAAPGLDDAVPVTIRFLESLVRITQAHAKLHMQPVCSVDDAAMAVFLMERTAYSLKVPLRALGPEWYSSSHALDSVFLSSEKACLQQQEAVLGALVDVIRHYRVYAPPTPGGAPTTSDAGGQRENEEDLLMSVVAKHVPTCRDRVPDDIPNILLQRRAATLRDFCSSIGATPSGMATQESILQLAQGVNTSFSTPCSRVLYPADAYHRSNGPPALVSSSVQAFSFTPPEFHASTPRFTLTEEASAASAGDNAKSPSSGPHGSAEGGPDGICTRSLWASADGGVHGAVDAMESCFCRSAASLTDGHLAQSPGKLPHSTMKRKRTADDIMRSLRFKF